MSESPITVEDLPTPDCTVELHEQMGGACFWCCGRCNYDTHQCRYCYLGIRHDGTNWPDPHSPHTHPEVDLDEEPIEYGSLEPQL